MLSALCSASSGSFGGGPLGTTTGGVGFWSGIGNVSLCLGAGGSTAFSSSGCGGGGFVGMGAAGGGPTGGGVGGTNIGTTAFVSGGLVETARQGCRGTEPDRKVSGGAFTGGPSPRARSSEMGCGTFSASGSPLRGFNLFVSTLAAGAVCSVCSLSTFGSLL